MRRASDLCDYFFICSANTTKHSKAIADGIVEELKKKRVRPWHTEGLKEGSWIILDYNSVVAHIFFKDTRAFYKLERLWGDVPRVDFSMPKKKRHAKKSHRRRNRTPR